MAAPALQLLLLLLQAGADAARRDSTSISRRRIGKFCLLCFLISASQRPHFFPPFFCGSSPFRPFLNSFLVAMAGRNAVVSFLKETYGKQTVLECIKAGGFKAFFDGSLA